MVQITESSDRQIKKNVLNKLNLFQFYTHAQSRGDGVVEGNSSHGYQLDPSLFPLPVAPWGLALNNE